MNEQPNEKKQEEYIIIKGCKIIFRYAEASQTNVLDKMGKILCGQKYAPENCVKNGNMV